MVKLWWVLPLVLVGLFDDGLPHNPRPAKGNDIAIVTSLTLSPATPQVGEVVTATFVIRNVSGNGLTLGNVGVGGRGPDCADWGCGNLADFPLEHNITLQPNGSYAYTAERIFWEEGDYFAQIVYEIDSVWWFIGERLDFGVGAGLQITSALTLDPAMPVQNGLTFAQFELHNAGSRPLTFESVGAAVRGPACVPFDFGCGDFESVGAAVRGPACVPFDFGCGDNVEFPFSAEIHLNPAETQSFTTWRFFPDVGTHFAQIAVLDALGVWHHIGDPFTFDVETPPDDPRDDEWDLAIHYHPVWNDGDRERLGLALSVGADLIRVAVSWSLLEPDGKGQWDADWYIPALTNVINTANEMGLDVYLMLSETPCWASSDPQRQCSLGQWNTAYPPRRNADYADAFRHLVGLYGEQVTVWEVWNEPNIERFWQPEPDPVAYTQLLQSAYTAIKDSDSSATVLGGSLAGSDIDFLDQLYQAGARSYFDALALHPYSGTLAPDECPYLFGAFECGVNATRSMMLYHNDDKPIWITEWGWSTFAGDGGVGEALQLTYLQQSLTMAEQWEFVPVLTWYNLIDSHQTPNPLDFEDQFGLFERDFRPKPSALWLRDGNLPIKLWMPIIGK